MLRKLNIKQFFARNKLFIGGNWKSNNTIQDSVAIVNNTINTLKYNPSKVGNFTLILDVVISPVTLHIPAIQKALNHPNVKISAQNSSNYNFGAYTG